jgi:pimeloyl-ACP methyl ester carboxylesterase
MEKVVSKDGTTIAYDKTGQGPAVILVSGATMARSGFVNLAQLLAPSLSIYNYDRRGRGDSTDTKPYALEREIDDIEALIDAAGGSASLYGISSGGCLALEAAAVLGDKVKKLAVYEVPYNSDPNDKPVWHEYYTKLNELVAADKRSDAAALFMKFVGMPDNMIEGMRSQPMWSGMEAVAPTLVYDAAAMGGETRVVPLERAAKVTIPTLVMDGAESLKIYPFMHVSADALANAMPNAERQTLDGQSHDVDSKVLAPVLIKFFNE